jgi:hypothetical protein
VFSSKDCFVGEVDSAAQSLWYADADSVADGSENHFASIFRVVLS